MDRYGINVLIFGIPARLETPVFYTKDKAEKFLEEVKKEAKSRGVEGRLAVAITHPYVTKLKEVV